MRGKFISLEGIDGAGKSTQLRTVTDWAAGRQIPLGVTREPGGTPLAEALRTLVLQQSMTPLTESLLMFAGRHDHVVKHIEPALARGEWVLSDRFTDASFAYPGGGRGGAAAILSTLESWVCGSLQPDLTLWFDLEPTLAQQRLSRNRAHSDRFEQEQEDFFRRVRQAYGARAVAARVHRIDADQSPEALAREVVQVLEHTFPLGESGG